MNYKNEEQKQKVDRNKLLYIGYKTQMILQSLK